MPTSGVSRETGSVQRIQNWREDEFPIGGWLPNADGHGGWLGALLLGQRDGEWLSYVGRVGTGFPEEMLAVLREALPLLAARTSPFRGKAPPRGALFVQPKLAAKVRYREVTADGALRHRR